MENKTSKKLLIITYYWPPAGGPGVQRWLKFVKYLPEFDVQPIVYVPENPTYPIVDAHLETEVSDKAIILKNKIFEPYQLASFLSKNKTKKITHTFDDTIVAEGANDLKIEVIDNVGNSAIFETHFFRSQQK